MKMSSLTPGIYPDIPSQEYHQRELGVISTGVVKLLLDQSPAHYRAWVDSQEQSDTQAMILGRAFHCAILEPMKFSSQFAVKPECDRRTKAGKDIYDTFLATYPDAEIISIDDMAAINGMRASLMKHPFAKSSLSGGESEVTCIWRDRRTALPCKARFDYLRKDVLVIADIKTCEDASPKAFAKSIANFKYHVQAAHYVQGAHAVFGHKFDFAFIAVEKKPPYAVAVYVLDGEALTRGDELRDRAVDLMNECLCAENFPAYSDDVQTLSLPAWAFSD